MDKKDAESTADGISAENSGQWSPIDSAYSYSIEVKYEKCNTDNGFSVSAYDTAKYGISKQRLKPEPNLEQYIEAKAKVLQALGYSSDCQPLQTSIQASAPEYFSSSSIVISMALLLLPAAGNTDPNRLRDSSR